MTAALNPLVPFSPEIKEGRDRGEGLSGLRIGLIMRLGIDTPGSP
jgi:hypothetical protein